MSVLIKGMDMPDKPEGIGSSGRDLRIWDDGTIELLNGYHTWRTGYKAVSLPPHGRLIDADALIESNAELADCDFIHPRIGSTLREVIEDAPTIVEAEGE